MSYVYVQSRVSLNYTREQYAVVAGTMKGAAEVEPDEAMRQEYLVATSACEEVLKLAEQIRTLRYIIDAAATDLRGKLDHFDRFSS